MTRQHDDTTCASCAARRQRAAKLETAIAEQAHRLADLVATDCAVNPTCDHAKGGMAYAAADEAAYWAPILPEVGR